MVLRNLPLPPHAQGWQLAGLVGGGDDASTPDARGRRGYGHRLPCPLTSTPAYAGLTSAHFETISSPAPLPPAYAGLTPRLSVPPDVSGLYPRVRGADARYRRRDGSSRPLRLTVS